MTEHARLSPSNARWPKCPGSVREEAVYPDVAGEAAIDGTGSHVLLDLCLQNSVPALDYNLKIIGANHHDSPNGWLVDEARCERVQQCLDYVERRIKELRVEHPGSIVRMETESRSDPGGMFKRDDWWGTADITLTVINQHKRCLFIEVIDYKDGRMYVDAKDNSQLTSYMGGKMRPYISAGEDFTGPFDASLISGGCRLTICQPKTNPTVRYENQDSTILFAKVICLNIAARMTDEEDAPLLPGEHCRWCKHRDNCDAETNLSMETLNMNTEIELAPANMKELLVNIEQTPSAKLVELSDAKEGMDLMFQRVLSEIERRIESGTPVDGFAMIDSRGKKVWNKSDEEIEKALKGRRLTKADIFPAKLITPAACLNLSGLKKDQKARIERDLISFLTGDPALKRVKNVTVKEDVTAMFDVVAPLEEAGEPALERPPEREPETPQEDITFF